MFSVSFYNERERQWQFAGSFEDRKEALLRKRMLMDGKPFLKVRIRRL